MLLHIILLSLFIALCIANWFYVSLLLGEEQYAVPCLVIGFFWYVLALVLLLITYIVPFSDDMGFTRAHFLLTGLIGLTYIIQGGLNWPEDRS